MNGTNRARWSALPVVALTVMCARGDVAAQGLPFPVNRAVAASLEAKGVPADVAGFFAATKVDSQCPTPTSCVYRQTFLNGVTRTITLTVLPNRVYTPTASDLAGTTPGRAPVYAFQYKGNFQADPATVSLSYYVAKAGLPRAPANRPQVRRVPDSTGPGGVVRLVGLTGDDQASSGPRLRLAAAQAGAGGAGIAWNEVGNKTADLGIGSAIDFAKAKGINVGALGSVYALASALSDVSTAWDLGKQNQKWLKELDALEQCAAHPTNQVSKSDPKYSNQTVGIVQRARSELKEVNSVRFLNIMTEKLADATPVTAVLAVGLKDGFVWSEQTLGDYSEKTIMREARLAVVKCDPPGNPNGNLQYESECTIGKDHTITRLIANVTWEWQAGVKYLPQGDYTYSKVRTVGTCTEQSSAAGPLAGTGYLFVFDDKARQKELGYGYEARFNNIPAVVTMSRSCGEGARLQADIDWIPVMHGFPGAGGKLSGVMPAPGCQASQPAKLTWDFSIPPAKK